MDSTSIRWTITELARGFGLDRRTVVKWLENVEPAGIEGRSKSYRLADAARAFYAPASGTGAGEQLDLNQQSARLKKAQADKTELEVQVLHGSLLEVADVEAAWSDQILTARSSFLTIPPRLAMQVKAMANDPLPVIEDVISEAITTALQSLASGRPRNKVAEAVVTTAKANGKRVVGDKPKPKPRKRRRRGAV